MKSGKVAMVATFPTDAAARPKAADELEAAQSGLSGSDLHQRIRHPFIPTRDKKQPGISAGESLYEPGLQSSRAFGARQDGGAAIEFAIVAPVFIAIILGLLELALLFITDVSLDAATASFATQIRTGQVQAPGVAATASSGIQMSVADAKTWICQKMRWIILSTCQNQIQLDIRPIASFQQMSTASPINGTQFNASNLCYYSGNGGDIVEIRAFYLYSLIDPLLSATFSFITSYQGSGTSTSSGHFFPIKTSQVFKSEVFTGANTGAGC